MVTDIKLVKRFQSTMNSAKSRGLKFDMTLKELKRLMNLKTCYFTGVRFTDEGDNKMSLDRVDSNVGYIDGNVVACTIRINGLKDNLSFEEIEMMYNKLKERRK